MQPTTVTTKETANGVSPKRSGQADDDAPGTGSPVGLQNLLQTLRAMRAGDFSVRMTGEEEGLIGKIADTFNDIAASNERMAQATRAGRPAGRTRGQNPPPRQIRPLQRRMGRDGSVGQHADRRPALADQGSDHAPSRPSRKATCSRPSDWMSTAGRSKANSCKPPSIVNTMIKQLSVFTSEVTRVAREVGTEGKLGGQAQVARSPASGRI